MNLPSSSMKKPKPTPPTTAAGRRGARPMNVSSTPMATSMKAPP
jgi:hypothetical protein